MHWSADDGSPALTKTGADAGGMANGKLKPIEEIRLGDRVTATDENERGTARARRVTGLARHPDPDLYRLKVAGETLRATAGHPFWVEGGAGSRSRISRRGWICASPTEARAD